MVTVRKKNDVKNLSKDDLNKFLLDLKKELMILRAKASLGTALESPGKIKSVKRNIARVLTFINQKEVKEKK